MEEILRKLQKEASGSKHRAIKESCTWAIGTGRGRWYGAEQVVWGRQVFVMGPGAGGLPAQGAQPRAAPGWALPGVREAGGGVVCPKLSPSKSPLPKSSQVKP